MCKLYHNFKNKAVSSELTDILRFSFNSAVVTLSLAKHGFFIRRGILSLANLAKHIGGSGF